jgi:hypothetical protein
MDSLDFAALSSGPRSKLSLVSAGDAIDPEMGCASRSEGSVAASESEVDGAVGW